MGYSIPHICEIVGGSFISKTDDTVIEHLLYDSRRIQQPAYSLFFAIVTEHNDGHRFIHDAYKKGVRNFIVSRKIDTQPSANIILVDDCLTALQKLAAYHRRQFNLPVIGITGSNGKTVVKEWLYQLLQADYNIVRSPKSYNSQIGVPLSVWQINEQHTLGIFEAGISAPGEMEKLQQIIHPTIGVLTNIGEAHDEGFASREQKLEEKLKLFRHAQIVIGEHHLIADSSSKSFTWSGTESATLQIISTGIEKGRTTISANYQGQNISITIPFTDEASIQNAITCWCVLLHLGVPEEMIEPRFLSLHAVDMRLQLKHGINNCIIINDSYSADTTSLKIALDFQQQQSSGLKRTVILSDFYETGKNDKVLYHEIAELLQSHKLYKVISIGEKIKNVRNNMSGSVLSQQYRSTEDFIYHFRTSDFADEIILIKGARKFEFEQIVQLFEQKLHQTLLEINLNALEHNLKEYQDLLHPQTKIMAMVKAFSYGNGGAEIASVLQFYNVHYLGVAYADEGAELVKVGITIPVMVMNAEESSFNSIVENNLQPVLYSFHLLKQFEAFLKDQALQDYPVHIEIETGMNRLGLGRDEIESVAKYISSSSSFKVQSVFSHLAASEDPQQDDFTMEQFEKFKQSVAVIQNHLAYPFLVHIANSAAIVRHPKLQMDMVRLGIGLYGIESDEENKLDLQAVATLRSTIAQLKHVKKGESVSYNRKGVVSRESVIATVRIGYADGYSRRFSNGAGKMVVKGKLAPVIGTVCMDMTMIDVTDIGGVEEGDDVIIFGKDLPVQQVAKWIKTIPYEIMTSVSQRVKRVYFHE